MRTSTFRALVALGADSVSSSRSSPRSNSTTSVSNLCTLNAFFSCALIAHSGKTTTLGIQDYYWGIFGFIAILVLAAWSERRRKDARLAYLLLLLTSAGLDSRPTSSTWNWSRSTVFVRSAWPPTRAGSSRGWAPTASPGRPTDVDHATASLDLRGRARAGRLVSYGSLSRNREKRGGSGYIPDLSRPPGCPHGRCIRHARSWDRDRLPGLIGTGMAQSGIGAAVERGSTPKSHSCSARSCSSSSSRTLWIISDRVGDILLTGIL